jgi:Fic family protein
VLSSKIEGTQASLSDLFYFEAANKEERQKEAAATDVLEVVNYVKAMNYGIKRLKDLPLSLRLIREIHKELMHGVRGQHLTPGEFRRSQNWIGPGGCTLNDAKFVPPPVHEMHEALGHLEKFLHDRENFPGLIQCALIHYQFEAIHPFLDGNGRVGRLLITLFLCEKEYLIYPMLYLSAFFEKYRAEYYERLLAVSEKGEWEEWIKLFLRAVAVQAKNAVGMSKSLLALRDKYRKQVQKARVSAYVLELLDEIFLNPFVTIPHTAIKLRTTYPTAKAAVNRLKEAKILSEVTNKRWGKVFCAKELFELLEE